MSRIALPERKVAVSCPVQDEWLGEEVHEEHRAALDEAASGAQVVAVQMADREARRALLADWVCRHADGFPGGRLYFDMGEARRDGAGDPSTMLGRFLRALGVPEEFVPAGFRDRRRALKTVAAGRRVVMVVDGVDHAPEARVAACPDGLLLVGSSRPLPGLRMDGAVCLALDGPHTPDEDVDVAALPESARTLYALLGHLPTSVFGPSLALTLLGAAGESAIEELCTAGLLVTAAEAGRFRLRDRAREHALAQARAEPPEVRLRALRQITDAYLYIVEDAAATYTATGAGDVARQTALEALEAEQHAVTGLMRVITHAQWHREVWRLALALRPLYGVRLHEADWHESHTLGVEAALWDGAVDVQAELRVQLARLELLCGSSVLHPGRAERAIGNAEQMLDLVSSDRLRGLIWQTRAELEDDRGRDPVSAWQQARRWYSAAGEHADATEAAARWGEGLVAAGRAQEALDVLTDTAAVGVSANLARASAYRALGSTGPAVAAALDAVEAAARDAQYRLCGAALALLADLAAVRGDEELLRLCKTKQSDLARVAGDSGGTEVR
ncbi:hypothetical protein ABZ820_05240 [Streptomyces diacarni]|uniref:hypothetical protein n=1 Tax=Streptomyces diacarni TaxID=2800381 RepID=UPI0033EFEBC2